MSLSRTALRLAVSRALLTDPVVLTVCGERVFDSLMPPIKGEPEPTIVVTTEESTGEAWNPNNGGPPFDEKTLLTLEIAIKGVEFDENGDPIGYSLPVSDREMEAQLDLLEHRVPDLLANGQSAEARLVRKVIRRIARKESERFVSEGVRERLAVRLVSLYVELFGDDGDPRDVPDGPYAVLPDPLRTVCAAMPPGTSGERVCQLLAGAYPPLADRTARRGMLNSIGFNQGPRPVEAPASGLPTGVIFPVSEDP